MFAGALRSTDPDRVVLKKVVLTGFPVKVHKKKAVVRWMFHAPEDVRWFRPVDLWTKHGRQGRIKVPLLVTAAAGHCPDLCASLPFTTTLTDTPHACRAQEAVGTHGAMKCIFDGIVQQQDSVCMSLYKRVFPKWPQSMQFA